MWFKKKKQSIKENDYLLRLEDIKICKGHIICTFSQKGEITSFQASIKELLTNFNIMRHIRPDVLLELRTIYERHQQDKHKVRILNVLRGNQYKIIYDDNFAMTMEGKEICKDLNLLELMNIKDIFKIVYNTAYQQTYKDCKSADQINQKSNNEHRINPAKDPLLKIIK